MSQFFKTDVSTCWTHQVPNDLLFMKSHLNEATLSCFNTGLNCPFILMEARLFVHSGHFGWRRGWWGEYVGGWTHRNTQSFCLAGREGSITASGGVRISLNYWWCVWSLLAAVLVWRDAGGSHESLKQLDMANESSRGCFFCQWILGWNLELII